MARSRKPAASRRYALSSWLFVRLVGGVYLIAFLSLWSQLDGLYGERGIAPIADLLERLRAGGDVGLVDLPTLAWLGASDGALHGYCAIGAVAAASLLAGVAPRLLLGVCWLVYLSFVSAGQPFLAFQWDSLLLETGFTALLLAPWTAHSSPRTAEEPPAVARWLLYWLLFRLMLSSGIVKLASGDPTWADLTALTYHYETQPLPHVLGWWAHQLPEGAHLASAAAMFVIELAVPFLIFWPGRPRRIGCAALVALQLLIAATGNYGFFNLLTIALCLLLLDDEALGKLLPGRARAWLAADRTRPDRPSRPHRRWAFAVPVLLLSAAQLAAAVARDTPGPVADVLRPVRGFHTFNRYGLFAVMTTERPEIVIEGSHDGRSWQPYVFRYKPVEVDEAPRFCAPHMPRLDWQMWFAALGNVRRNGWVVRLMRQLMQGEPAVIGLLEHDPFPQQPPEHIRAVVYDYRFTDPETRSATGNWWRRANKRLYAPVLRRHGAAPAPSAP